MAFVDPAVLVGGEGDIHPDTRQMFINVVLDLNCVSKGNKQEMLMRTAARVRANAATGAGLKRSGCVTPSSLRFANHMALNTIWKIGFLYKPFFSLTFCDVLA